MKTIKERYVFDTEGKKTDVILSLSDYDRLLEDLFDLAVIAERHDEIPVSLDEMKKKLYNNKDGVNKCCDILHSNTGLTRNGMLAD